MRLCASWRHRRLSCKAATERGTLCWSSGQHAMIWGTGALTRQSALFATAWTTPLRRLTSHATPEDRFSASLTSQVLLPGVPCTHSFPYHEGCISHMVPAAIQERGLGLCCVCFVMVNSVIPKVAYRHAGLRTRNLDVKALQAVFELLQSHYPERLHALWFLNAPFIFWGVWRMVRLQSRCLLSPSYPKHLHRIEVAL